MACKQQKNLLIYEKRYEEMLTPSDPKTTLRNAYFLNPISKPTKDSSFSFPPNTTPLPSEIFSHDLQQWPSNVIFKAWYCPQKKWKCWVNQLAPKFSAIWTQSGIHGAIMASLYEVRSSPNIVLGLSEFWCPDTNSFVFPWGEATITLEDVMILGGYPVLGECLTSSAAVTKKVPKLEKKFKDYKSKILSELGIRATHYGWLTHFMEEFKESNGNLVHVAFLCIWLSRYVFPSVAGTSIVNSFIPIAVKLSLGFKLALGPAVLASLYRNLSILSKQAVASKQNINVAGSFQLLQIWAFERFPILGPKALNFSKPGEPRMARWNKVKKLNLNLPLVRMAVQEAKNFRWRPYAAILKYWNPPAYYEENEQCFSDCSSLDEVFRSFYRFLLASELVGIDCREKYFPHRVAMQFGLDQDIPAHIFDLNCNAFEPVKLFVPSRSFKPSVSLRYSNWWKGLMLAREDKVKDVLLRSKDYDQASSSIQVEGNSQDCHATVAPDSEDSSDSSFETLPPGTSTEVPLTGTTSANNDEAGVEDLGVLVKERNPTDFPATPPIINEANSMVSPPGFKKLSSCAENQERRFEFCPAVFGSASLPCANNAKVSSVMKEPLVSSKAKTGNAGLPEDAVPKNMVKRVALSDDDDDDVIVFHLNKETTVKNCLKSWEGKAQETAQGVNENVCTFASNETGISKEIKEEAGSSVNEPIEVDDVRVGIGSSKDLNGSAKTLHREGKRKFAGDSPSNPINLDDEDIDSARSKSRKQGQNFAERLKYIEKLLGVGPSSKV